MAWLVRRHRLDVVHARAHIPAATMLLAERVGLRRLALIFDLRGLMAEEYEDAGRWRRGGVPFRLTVPRRLREAVVGGFQQLDEITQTPFGRYLDALERGFEEGRKSEQLGADLWAMEWPTARNLSIPRLDLERIGLFDERFRTCCEDQDLAERAIEQDIRFIYNAAIECLHNDQAADLERYCRFQERGARDTVLLCA